MESNNEKKDLKLEIIGGIMENQLDIGQPTILSGFVTSARRLGISFKLMWKKKFARDKANDEDYHPNFNGGNGDY